MSVYDEETRKMRLEDQNIAVGDYRPYCHIEKAPKLVWEKEFLFQFTSGEGGGIWKNYKWHVKHMARFFILFHVKIIN